MKKFSDLNISPNLKSFVGQKISISRIFNVEIIIVDFKIGPSSVKPGTDRLDLQIKVGQTMHVVFTGSKILMQMIQEVPKGSFPIAATIINNDGHFEFT